MKLILNKKIAVIAVGLSLSSLSLAADINFSGFANVTGGYVFSGSPTPNQYPADTPNPFIYQPNSANGAQTYKCPCFAGNYEYAGMYEYHNFSMTPETSVGLQAQIKIDPKLSATVQMVARGADNFKADIDWAYVSYELSPELTLQAGHKRLPIYNYSDYMYVGYAYPWVRPPQDLYGWQIYSYDGINLLGRKSFGDLSITGNVWIGNQRDKNNATLGQIYYGTTIDEQWSNIIGAYVDFNKSDEYDLRLVMMKNDVTRSSTYSGSTSLLNDKVGQTFYGISFNVDKNDWIARTEINYFTRPSNKDTYKIYLASLGYKFTPTVSGYLTQSSFQENYAGGAEHHKTNTITARWDFTHSANLKFQLDDIKEYSDFPFTGNAKMFSVSYNTTF